MTGRIILFFAFLLSSIGATAQRAHSEADIDSLRKYEMKLKAVGDSMIDGSTQAVRLQANIKYIPLLVDALKIPGSYSYPFDSLRFMFKFRADNNSFRLFNWNIKFKDGTFRYYGAIQVNNSEKLQLIPLFDRVKDDLENPEDTVLDFSNWYGAQYYQMIEKNHKGKYYYVLLGWDGYTPLITRKVIDVLWFEKSGRPKFGAPLFEQGKDTMLTRVIFQFNSQAVMQLKYSPDQDIIVFDNLVAPNKINEGKFETYVPEGTYNYYVYNKKKGIWQFREMLFDSKRSPTQEAERGYEKE